MASKNPIEFIQEVRAEGSKVTWPARREVIVTSIAVLVMIAISAAFFFLVDIVIKFGVEKGIFGI